MLSSVVRLLTSPRVLRTPDTLEAALSFCDAVRSQPNAVAVSPGPRHWTIFSRLCRHARATGDLVPDAYLAALAVESGCELISTDADFARFPGLAWRHPLAAA